MYAYDFFWRANEQKPTAFFCLCHVCLFCECNEEIKKKSCFFAQTFLLCTKILSGISLNTKGDIFLSRARINTHTRGEESCSRFIIAVVV